MIDNKLKNKIVNGNSIKELKKIPSESFDLIFADPPYNLQLRNNLIRPDRSKVNAVNDKWDQFESFKTYDDFTYTWLSECKRVLKKNGYLIIAQTNTFQINEMIHPRKFFINFSKFLVGEHHQYSHSDTIKSLLLETKLKKHFKKYKNSWWMNNWIFTYGWNDVWKFETNRRLLSYGRLKNILTKNKFIIKDSCGSPFFYNNKNIFSKLILSILDKILMFMNKIFIFSFFLKYISGSNIFLCQKRADF